MPRYKITTEDLDNLGDYKPRKFKQKTDAELFGEDATGWCIFFEICLTFFFIYLFLLPLK